ncbi:MAG: hypothetical protein WBD81_17975 [Collimonas pratensis]|uniref:hypothetical protein n=1 Tax=Collimonas pratensis TaxID=279113 RepID=UPI003C780BBF
MEAGKASPDRPLPSRRNELGSLSNPRREELQKEISGCVLGFWNADLSWLMSADAMTSVFIDGWRDMRWNTPEEIDRRIEKVHTNYLEFYRKQKRSE